jgi:hypothetical protein
MSDQRPMIVSVLGGDFYVAAGVILPVLVLSEIVEKAVVMRVPSEDVGERLARLAPHVQVLGTVLWSLFFGWAEWVCLRSLEDGHSATGGPVVVWVALGLAWLQLVARWTGPSIFRSAPNSSAPGSGSVRTP